MRRYTYIYIMCLLAGAALVAAACSGSSEAATTSPAVEPEAPEPVAFDTPTIVSDFNASPTRAPYGHIGNEELQKWDPNHGPGIGFGVFGCYTGLHKYTDSNVQPNFMYNEHVWFDKQSADANPHGTNLWQYEPVKYWPNGEGNTLPDGTGTTLPSVSPEDTNNGETGEYNHYVSFFAYAPWSNNDSSDPDANPWGYCIPTFSYQHEITNPWLTYRLHPKLDHQVDLLSAIPLIDRVKPQQTERLPFQFQHALSCVAHVLSVRCSDTMKENLLSRIGTDVSKMQVKITSLKIDYELTEHGRLIMWRHDAPYWEPILSGDYMTTRSVDYYTDLIAGDGKTDLVYDTDGSASLWVDDTKGVYYIPTHHGHHRQTATISMTFQIIRYAAADPSTPIVEWSRRLSTTLTLSDYIDAYQPSRCLNLGLIIDENTLSLMASIDDWDDGSVHNQKVAE